MEKEKIIFDSKTCYYCKKVHETEELNKRCCEDIFNNKKT